MYNAYQMECHSVELLNNNTDFVTAVNTRFIKHIIALVKEYFTNSKNYDEDKLKSILNDEKVLNEINSLKLIEGGYDFNNTNHDHVQFAAGGKSDYSEHLAQKLKGQQVVDIKAVSAQAKIAPTVEVKGTVSGKGFPKGTHSSDIVFVYRLDSDILEVYYKKSILDVVLNSIIYLINTNEDSIETINNTNEELIAEASRKVKSNAKSNTAEKNVNDYILLHSHTSSGITEKCISVRVEKVEIPLPTITDFKRGASK
jgi:hypothetical protein